jgi:hypothetical protein
MTDPVSYRIANFIDFDNNGAKDDLIVRFDAKGNEIYKPVYFGFSDGTRVELKLDESALVAKNTALLQAFDLSLKTIDIEASDNTSLGATTTPGFAYALEVAGDMTADRRTVNLSVTGLNAEHPQIDRVQLKSGVKIENMTATDLEFSPETPASIYNSRGVKGDVTHVITLK